MFNAIYKILCFAYRTLLHKILYNAINDPKKKWDDMMMQAADIVFKYEK